MDNFTKVKTPEEIEQIRENAKVHKICFDEIKKTAKVWTSASFIDELVWDICEKHWVLPAFKWTYWFPSNICVSVNDVVAHWIPYSDIVFEEWDVVTFDFWVKDKKLWLNTDAAFTMIIWEGNYPELEDFLRVNKEALMKWLEKAVAWNTIWDIWNAIESHIKKSKYCLIKGLSWHWIWTELHENPYVYNYWTAWEWEVLEEWYTICIEPLMWMTSWEIVQDEEWNIYTEDSSIWSQFEHMILIKDWYPEILI